MHPDPIGCSTDVNWISCWFTGHACLDLQLPEGRQFDSQHICGLIAVCIGKDRCEINWHTWVKCPSTRALTYSMPCSSEEYVPVLTVRLSGNVVSILLSCQPHIHAASHCMWNRQMLEAACATSVCLSWCTFTDGEFVCPQGPKIKLMLRQSGGPCCNLATGNRGHGAGESLHAAQPELNQMQLATRYALLSLLPPAEHSMV